MKKFKSLFLVVLIGVSLFLGLSRTEVVEATEAFAVYQDDNVLIMFKKISSKGVVFDVYNKTNINLTIQADSIAVNGVSTNDIIMSSDIAPQSVGEAVAKTSQQDILAIKDVNRVSGQLRVIDFNTWDSYDALFDVPVNETPGYYELEYALPLLYTDNSVDIYYYSVEPTGVSFLVRNKTGINITIQADSVSVNGRSYNRIIMSDDVAPHSVGIVKAKCTVDGAGVPTQFVGGQLRVIDFNTWSSYKATFVNIPIAN